jgi:uncharacterized membrane protein YkoI
MSSAQPRTLGMEASMKKFLAAIALSALCLTLAAADSEKKIQKKDLPAAVQKAMEEKTQGAEIKGYSKEVENGKTFYEVETTVDGRSRDLLYDPTGKLVEVEEEIALDKVPAGARAAIEKAAAGGKVRKVEALTKGGTVSYEAAITNKAGKKSEVLFKADGTKGKE